MRKVRLVLVFVLLALTLGVRTGIGVAQEPPPENPAVSLPDGSPSAWDDDDLRLLVDLAINEQITVSQAQSAWEHLSEEQREKAGEFLAVRAGVSVDEWHRFVNSNRVVWQGRVPREQAIAPLGFPGEIWREPIENIWTYGYPPG